MAVHPWGHPPGSGSYGELQALVEQRARGIPVAYLIGRRGFWTLDVIVSSATLIPRAETETLVEQALQRLDHASERRVADLGTGSGAIALAIACERPQAQVLATDNKRSRARHCRTQCQRTSAKSCGVSRRQLV